MFSQIQTKSCCAALYAAIALFPTQSVAQNEAKADDILESQASSNESCIRILDMELGSVLELISKTEGFTSRPSEALHGDVSNEVLCGDFQQRLEMLSKVHSFDWFVYAGSAFYSPADETETRFFPLGALNFYEVSELFAEGELILDETQIASLANGTIMKIDGPPKLLEVAQALITISATPPTTRDLSGAILVRRGVYASLELHGDAARRALLGDDTGEITFLRTPSDTSENLVPVSSGGSAQK